MPSSTRRRPSISSRAWIAVLAIALGACGGLPSTATVTPVAASASASAAPAPSAAGTVTLPSISATDPDSFGIDISGSGSAVSNVHIKSRFGTLSLGGTSVAALVYERIPWTGYSLVLYQALAIQAHSWTVFWFYCSGSALTYVYWESTTTAAVRKETMKGTCTPTSLLSTSVSWPAMSAALPARVAGFEARGPLLTISSAAAGSAVLDGRTWSLYPYAVVDCSSACGAPGWYELHTLMWDSGAGSVAYGILYLYPGQAGQVRLAYGLELPDLQRLADTWYSSPWSRTA